MDPERTDGDGAASEGAVALDVDGDVATITLQRPEVRNALTAEVSDDLVAAVDEAEAAGARAVVITGSEGHFCAGGDVNMMAEGLAGEVSPGEKERAIRRYTHRAVERVARCTVPTVAKVEGAAYGAGGALTLACDVVMAGEEASISFAFRQVGLAVDSGTSVLLPRVVGMHVAKELVLTGESLGPERAEDLGLFNHVFPEDELDERTREFAERVAAGPTVALQASKGLLDRNVGRGIAAAMDAEAAAQTGVLETDDHREGAEAFMGGRSPEFEGR